MTYTIRYETKKGGSGVMNASSITQVKATILRCFREKLECRAEKDGEVIARSYKDDSGKWNCFVDTES